MKNIIHLQNHKMLLILCATAEVYTIYLFIYFNNSNISYLSLLGE